MKITRRQLRRIIREEVETLEYEMLQDTTDELLDADHPEDVVPQRDSWAGGQNVHNQVDHGEASGGGPNTRGQEIMKVTESQLRRIIREAIDGTGVKEPMTPDYVRKQMMGKAVGPNAGQVFMDIALDAIDAHAYQAAANALMDGLWIDDPPAGAERELEDLLANASRAVAATEDDIAAIGAEWGTRHFRSNW